MYLFLFCGAFGFEGIKVLCTMRTKVALMHPPSVATDLLAFHAACRYILGRCF
jgi:hypothetical protein